MPVTKPALPEGRPLDAASAALHEAVHRGNPGGVTRAIERGADIESLHPKSGETALMLASRLCNFKIVEILLKAGASITTRSVERYTVLHTGCIGGNTAILRRLLKEGASVASRTKFGDTPLISAAVGAHEEAINLLLRAGADVNARDREDRTALMWASTHGKGGTVSLLLAAGAKHDLYDDKGAQALHNATQHERLVAMAALVRAGADPNARSANIGDTPLHMAVRHHRLEATKLLMHAGALADVKDRIGYTPLHSAIRDGYTDIVSAILSRIRQQDEGLPSSDDRGLSMEEKSAAAAQRSRRQKHQQREQYGGDESFAGPRMRKALSARNNEGLTALHIATMVYSLDVVNLLLRCGALETERDRTGETPFLHPVRCAQGNPIPVFHNSEELGQDISLAYRIVRSLSRARAARARSWLWPASGSSAAGTVVAARTVAKRKHVIATRALRVTNTKRSSVFLRAVRRYVDTKGHVILEDGQILAPPRKPRKPRKENQEAAGRQLAVV